jgi:hypothetical protein
VLARHARVTTAEGAKEKQLRDSEARFRLLAATTPIKDAAGRIVE